MLSLCAKSRRILGLLVSILSLAGLTAWAQQPTLHVAPGESIQAAIDAAPDGALIQVADGVYQENLQILRSVTLRGNPQTPSLVAIEAKAMGPVITISGIDLSASVEGVSLSGAFGYTAHGIAVYGSAGAFVNRTIVHACKEDGIAIHSSGEIDVRNCEIHGNRRFGITVHQQEASVTGGLNNIHDNGVALGFYAPPDLRQPLAAPSGRQMVSVPEDYPTVQEAVDAVAEYGTIVVAAGQYTEGLTLWKPLTLRGQGEAETTLRPTAGCIVGGSVLCSVETITLEQVKLTDGWWLAGGEHILRDLRAGSRSGIGLVLTETGRGIFERASVVSVGGAGLLVTGHANAHLDDCTFSGNITGLRVEEQGFIEVEACHFEENRFAGLVLLGESKSNVIRTSGFARSQVGILQQNTGHISVEHCTFEESKRSGVYSETGTIHLSSCAFQGADTSAIRTLGGCISAARCVISGTQEAAVFAAQAGSVELTDCVITENLGVGISAGGTSHAKLVGCEISLNGLGGSGEPGASGVLVSDNAIVMLEDCSIERNAGYGVEVTPWSEAARLDPSVSGTEPPKNELTLSDCRISENNLTGLYIVSARRVMVSGTQFLNGYEDGATIEVDCAGEIELVDCEFADNLGSGLAVYGASGLQVDRCSFLRNSTSGLFIAGASVVSVSESHFAGHPIGIGLCLDPVVSLTDCRITGNPGYGLLIYGLECSGGQHLHQAQLDFTGELTGSGNWIPGPSGLNGNGLGGICPDSGWEFLLRDNPGAKEGQSG